MNSRPPRRHAPEVVRKPGRLSAAPRRAPSPHYERWVDASTGRNVGVRGVTLTNEKQKCKYETKENTRTNMGNNVGENLSLQTRAGTPFIPTLKTNARAMPEQCCRGAWRASRKKAQRMPARVLPAGRAVAQSPNTCSKKARGELRSGPQVEPRRSNTFAPGAEMVGAKFGQSLGQDMARAWPKLANIGQTWPRFGQI